MTWWLISKEGLTARESHRLITKHNRTDTTRKMWACMEMVWICYTLRNGIDHNKAISEFSWCVNAKAWERYWSEDAWDNGVLEFVPPDLIRIDVYNLIIGRTVLDMVRDAYDTDD